jgi:Holliday junction resolvasome RuvABC endonuclease subunit
MSNDRIFERVQKFVEFFKPAIIVLRDCDTPTSRKNERTKQLTDRIVSFAVEKEIPVYKYKRQQIRDVFEQCGATSKYEIAHEIIREFSELASRAPKLREQWMEEDYNMGIFDSIALVTTHKYLTE